jgi:hypothetical protein
MQQNNKIAAWPREGAQMLPQDVASNRGAATRVQDSWDPYDVWLTRVKIPRDRLPRRSVVVEAQGNGTGHAASDGPHESLLLPFPDLT